MFRLYLFIMDDEFLSSSATILQWKLLNDDDENNVFNDKISILLSKKILNKQQDNVKQIKMISQQIIQKIIQNISLKVI